MATTDAGPKTPVKTTQTTFRILEALRNEGGCTVTELSNHLDLPKSSTHNYLRTLEHEGYVVDRDGTYEVGLRFLDFGSYARVHTPLYHVAKPQVDELARETGEIVNLLVEENGRGIFLYRACGANAVNIETFTGECIELHTTALGKTILAHLPPERRDEIVDRYGLEPMTANTRTDRSDLYADLEEIRSAGVAYSDEERIRGLSCVAVPLLDGDEISGAVSVSGPTSRMAPGRLEDEVVEKLRDAANIIELNHLYS